jgi:hypothetical protein
MFDRIWKEQIVQPKGKLGIWKPKEELKPREEDDDDCCEKARVYYKDIFVISQMGKLRRDYPELKGKSTEEIYDSYFPGLGMEDNFNCDRFRKTLEEMSWDIAIKTMKFWKECEGNV